RAAPPPPRAGGGEGAPRPAGGREPRRVGQWRVARPEHDDAGREGPRRQGPLERGHVVSELAVLVGKGLARSRETTEALDLFTEPLPQDDDRHRGQWPPGRLVDHGAPVGAGPTPRRC